MPEFITQNRTRIVLPEGFVLEDIGPMGEPRLGTASSQFGGAEQIVQGLTNEGTLQQLDAFQIAPLENVRRTPESAAVVEAPIAEGQRVALLIEVEGALRWVIPDDTPSAANVRPRSGQANTATFTLRSEPDGQPQAAGRGGFGDFIRGWFGERLKGFVISWAASAVVDTAGRLLERGVTEGLIALDSNDATHWTPSKPLDLSDAKRIMLFLHGTFSSTAGTFGDLWITAEGRAFLDDLRGRYDRLIAFDHFTLSQSPRENADAIVTALKAAGVSSGAHFDVIAFSRGGLVARELIEGEITGAPKNINAAMFVGASNGGTLLAEPSNWKEFLDYYTNAAAVAGFLLNAAALPVVGKVVSESVKTLAGLVMAAADHAITDEALPGIAAMQPSGDVVTTLNTRTPAPENAAQYHVVGSNFDATVRLGDTNLSKKLLRALADLNVDSLMDTKNDLVIPTDAMAAFGAHAEWLKSSLIWRANSTIFHLNYFSQGAVIAEHRRVFLDDSGNLLEAEAREPASALKERLRGRLPSDPVVISRSTPDGDRVYARTVEVVAGALFSAMETLDGTTVEDALDLHNTDAAQVQDGGALPPDFGAEGWVYRDGGAITQVVTALTAHKPAV